MADIFGLVLKDQMKSGFFNNHSPTRAQKIYAENIEGTKHN